tara:strand:- start:121 stop:273 length:153 start_codon:yes stop_codon:yes gene_type:complete
MATENVTVIGAVTGTLQVVDIIIQKLLIVMLDVHILYVLVVFIDVVLGNV